ncbi:S-adenosyl-L-methionine-dependent methyltransferase [Tothia fuscella]|uniref:S-adenosyl-L-methionine-dependent methyltransferase n=1 Tax=Tothia fuscella TaxID=1048955 RepID=A0A9P4NGN9_9PEZI|nr:S-adenosyl-L-methionine-dependent methyltransferase [Tothia fuscella]
MSPAVKEEYHLGEHEETLELFKLRNAQNCCSYLLPHLSSVSPSFRMLDLGCGPASITFDLANMFPNALIVGVDSSKQVISQNQAKSGKSSKHGNIEFRVGDMLEPLSFLQDSEMGTFDVVHEHAILIHMPDVPEALRQMRRMSRAVGGVIASRKGDMTSQILHPPCPENMALILKSYESSHGDASVGRKLVEYAMEAGWRREQIASSASILTNRTDEERRIYANSMLANLHDENSEMQKKAAEFGFGPGEVKKMQENLIRFVNAAYGSRLLICCEMLCFNSNSNSSPSIRNDAGRTL